MIINSVVSSISFSFNNSWLAHMGSRIYRIAIRILGGLLGETFFSTQLYSGERLYRLVDTYRQSKRDRTSYDRARFYYVGGILTALQGEKDPLEKTRKAKSILNTHVMGLSILREDNKSSLSQHIAYTLLPSLIDEFGKKMATTSILALHELDSLASSRNDTSDRYAKVYRDITVQQKELNSFVEALEQLNSGISKDILINELLLSRNRNLSKTAKDKIAEILQSQHYINIKLYKKLQIVNLIRSSNPEVKFDNPRILSKLRENRNNQLKALCHRGPSMFFTSDELDNVSLKNEETVFDTEKPITSKIRFPEDKVRSTSNVPFISEALSASPIGISNTQLNCWYNSTLQILSNTPIHEDILQHKDTLATDFPTIFASFNLYQRVFLNQIMYPKSFAKSKIANIELDLPNIRKEAHHKLDKEFKEIEMSQEDSQRFLYSLLEKLSIPVTHQIWWPGEKIPSVETKHLLLEKPAPSQLVDNPDIAFIKINLQTLFASSDHQIYGIIFHRGTEYSHGRDFDSGHYFTAVKKNGSWYLCDDERVEEISEAEVEDLLQKNKALLIASSSRNGLAESDVD